MITPDKYLNLKTSLINVSAFVIKSLKKIHILAYTELENDVERTLGEDAKQVLPYALNFLYLLGKIEYNKSIDSLNLINEN